MSRLGPLIKNVRHRKRMRQSDLAERAGVTVNYLSLVENGRRRPSQKCLERLADAMGLPLVVLQWYSLPRPQDLGGAELELYSSVDALVSTLMGS